jgi:hypothetical protein
MVIDRGVGTDNNPPGYIRTSQENFTICKVQLYSQTTKGGARRFGDAYKRYHETYDPPTLLATRKLPNISFPTRCEAGSSGAARPEVDSQLCCVLGLSCEGSNNCRFYRRKDKSTLDLPTDNCIASLEGRKARDKEFALLRDREHCPVEQAR